MTRAGITGNIGTGKTTVCRIFESLGIKVYYADREAASSMLTPKLPARWWPLPGNRSTMTGWS